MKTTIFLLLTSFWIFPKMGNAQIKLEPEHPQSPVWIKTIKLEQTPEKKAKLPLYLGNLHMAGTSKTIHKTRLAQQLKSYRFYLDQRYLNYQNYLRTKQLRNALYPNRHYLGGHLADDYTWDKSVSFE